MYAFILIPILDLLIPEDTNNPTKEQSQRVSKAFRFKVVTALWVPTQYALMFYMANEFCIPNLALYEMIGVIVSFGMISGGIGINVAHELIHKPCLWERILARTLLISVWYGHWAEEHIHVHHRLVATPYDPASSRKGETFYGFWWRSVTGTWRTAWCSERFRLRDASIFQKIFANSVVQYTAASAILGAVFWVKWGWLGLMFYLLQAPVAISMLEAVNYIEHYGLERKLRADAPPQSELDRMFNLGDFASLGAAFEKVSPLHSWNAGQTVTNCFLLKLQRHSDHHANGGRRYQVLRSFLASPQLPTGYAGCMLLAVLAPPLWFTIMEVRLEKAQKVARQIKASKVAVFTEEFDRIAREMGSVEEALRAVATAGASLAAEGSSKQLNRDQIKHSRRNT
eukprot:CAMPEP_0184496170 /NCGR_PEP_ID=MMETSP0113_2-20130426/33284_1 /TAXON_ID=91329 /ORGANISM="Norrisiella sphaerica, Strain BC52" /LENGTH=397 /DNA_ID=CAMNT_0026882687 /DNA_START=120 /DNA_END=1310 /DNA_ORIENTATION=-